MINKLKEEHYRFFKTHKNQPIKVRIQYLKKLKIVLEDKELEIYDALYEDLKKPIFESFASEFLMVLKEIDSFTKNIKEWESKGGIGIVHTNTGSTLNSLKKLGYK